MTNRGPWVPVIYLKPGVELICRLIPNLLPDNTQFSFTEHFVKQEQKKESDPKGFTLRCSAGYQDIPLGEDKDGNPQFDHNEGRCVTCHYGYTGKYTWIGKQRHVMPFQLIDLRLHHKIPVENKKTRDGDQIYKYEVCQFPHRCQESCQKGYETDIGGRKIILLGTSHLAQLQDFNDQLAKTCLSCGGRIYIVGYECKHCGSPFIDPANNQEFTELDMIETGRDRLVCTSCGANDFPSAIRECSNKSCQDPAPASVYDCNLRITKAGEGTKSVLNITRADDYWGPLDDSYTPYMELFNFPALFRPDSLAKQAELLALPIPNSFKAPASSEY